jgi:hypothetical protein
MSLDFQRSTRPNITEDRNICNHRSDRLNSYIIIRRSGMNRREIRTADKSLLLGSLSNHIKQIPILAGYICNISLVDKVTSYCLDGQGTWARFPPRARDIFLVSTESAPAAGPSQPPTQWVARTSVSRIKRPGREADHYLISSADVTMMKLYTHSLRRVQDLALKLFRTRKILSFFAISCFLYKMSSSQVSWYIP